MNNVFKANTVDGIISKLVTTIDSLGKLQAKKLQDAEVQALAIEQSTQRRNEALAEVARAEKIAANVKKLLDIN